MNNNSNDATPTTTAMTMTTDASGSNGNSGSDIGVSVSTIVPSVPQKVEGVTVINGDSGNVINTTSIEETATEESPIEDDDIDFEEVLDTPANKEEDKSPTTLGPTKVTSSPHESQLV